MKYVFTNTSAQLFHDIQATGGSLLYMGTSLSSLAEDVEKREVLSKKVCCFMSVPFSVGQSLSSPFSQHQQVPPHSPSTCLSPPLTSLFLPSSQWTAVVLARALVQQLRDGLETSKSAFKRGVLPPHWCTYVFVGSCEA